MNHYSTSVNEPEPSKRPVVDHNGQPHCAPANVIPFRFEGKPVRTLLIDSQPWFAAKDIVDSLEYSKSSSPAKLTEHVPDQWKGVNPIHTPGGTQKLLMLSEQGLYFFLGRSDKPKALPFQMWLAGDVLPSIRKHGRYVDSGNRMGTLIGQTIGTDGFHCLAAVLDGKVGRLPAKLRTGAKNHVWSQVRKAFSVSTVEDIPASDMDSVRTFIAAYALEGEWMPKPAASDTLSPADWVNLDCLIHCMKRSKEIFDKYGLYQHLTGIGSRAGIEMVDYLSDGFSVASGFAHNFSDQIEKQRIAAERGRLIA